MEARFVTFERIHSGIAYRNSTDLNDKFVGAAGPQHDTVRTIWSKAPLYYYHDSNGYFQVIEATKFIKGSTVSEMVE